MTPLNISAFESKKAIAPSLMWLQHQNVFQQIHHGFKGNQNPHIKFTFIKVFINENNQWKFEQNQAKNKEVTALWNLAISRGRYSRWWQVVDNSPYVLYMKFHVFPLFWWLRQFPSLTSRYDKQGCILHGMFMKSGHENTRIESKFEKNEILCTKWMESCPQLSP